MLCFLESNPAYELGVEALVSWLLDHPDIHVTEVSDADTVSDEYSDEEVLEELEEAEPTFPVVCLPPFISGVTHSVVVCVTLHQCHMACVLSASWCSRDRKPDV